jgi:hypothetical protein
MSDQPPTAPRPFSDLLFGMAGPIVWAIHFFGLYLAEAFLCPPSVSPGTGIVRPFAVAMTILALAVLIWLRVNAHPAAEARSGTTGALAFKRPLIDISFIAVLWTSIPIFVIEACRSSIG